MTTYLLLLAITFTVFVSAGILINYCKRRANSTNHGLSGTCQKSGGAMCSCCGASYLASRSGSSTPPSC